MVMFQMKEQGSLLDLCDDEDVSPLEAKDLYKSNETHFKLIS